MPLHNKNANPKRYEDQRSSTPYESFLSGPSNGFHLLVLDTVLMGQVPRRVTGVPLGWPSPVKSSYRNVGRNHFVLEKLGLPENHIPAQEFAQMRIATGLFARARK